MHVLGFARGAGCLLQSVGLDCPYEHCYSRGQWTHMIMQSHEYH